MNIDESLAKNDFISLHLNEAEPFHLTVSFTNYPRRWGYVGLDYVLVKGFLEGCTACLQGKKGNIMDEDVQYIYVREMTKSDEKSTTQYELDISNKPSMSSKKEKTGKKTHIIHDYQRTVTFCEFAKGKTPVWIFKASPQNHPPLLDSSYCIPLKLEFLSSPPSASGVFTVETLRRPFKTTSFKIIRLTP